MSPNYNTTESENAAEPFPFGYEALDKRSSDMMELYKSGKTLQEIGKVFGITRERVRQIVKKAIEQVIENESVLKGVFIDTTVYNEGLSKKRKDIQESEKIAKKPKVLPKVYRWSKYYISCRLCGTMSIPHVRKGMCEECLGIFRADRREDIIARHSDKCDVCGKLRMDARLDYGRDLFITKSKSVLCRECFRKSTGEVLGNHKNYDWSRYHQKCEKCGTTDVPHVRRGLCENCCDIYSKKQRESLIKMHGERCDYCRITRNAAQVKQKRDLYVTKGGEVLVLCSQCFQKTAKARFFKKSAAV